MLKEEAQAFEVYMEERFELFETPQVLKEAMGYSLFSAGKRIRPLLCFAVANLKDGAAERVYPLAMAIEMIHTYSLIHDDLPAMDDDDIRRGKPSNHIVYGEAVAILAGDGLLSQSFEVLTELETTPELLKRVIVFFSRCVGINGMVGGQALDIELDIHRETAVTMQEMQIVHRKKTGKLIELSMIGSAVLLNLASEQLEIIEKLAKIIGMLFQAVDDLLDGDETTGKTQNIDVKNGKVTYLTLLGKEKTSDYVDTLYQQAQELLTTLHGLNTESLSYILDKIVQRVK